LKNLKAGLGYEPILRAYHPDALELLNATSDLRSVFEELQNQEDLTREGGAQLFRMFFPNQGDARRQTPSLPDSRPDPL
jgi:hypothetical protein